GRSLGRRGFSRRGLRRGRSGGGGAIGGWLGAEGLGDFRIHGAGHVVGEDPQARVGQRPHQVEQEELVFGRRALQVGQHVAQREQILGVGGVGQSFRG